MNHAEVTNILERISYKPGWTFSAYHNTDNCTGVLTIEFHAPCVETGKPTMVCFKQDRDFSYYFSEEDVVRDIQNMIRRMESHELDEWLKYDSRRLTPPHADEKLALGGRLRDAR